MYILPELTAQVTLPKATFSLSEHYFLVDLGEGTMVYLPPGWGWGVVGGGCLGLGVREKEMRPSLPLLRRMGEKQNPKPAG